MATRPLPPGTVNVTCNIPKDLHKALQVLSAKSGMKIGTYVRHILSNAEKKKVQYQATITEVTEPLAAVETQEPAATKTIRRKQ